jgi:flavin reductase (DIM6/NTAB) family NADH-FMN oxidoreductase RutF
VFYQTDKNDHGLPHDPFKAIVAPRPIGWISAVNRDGEINLSPYSYFNAVGSRPPVVVFSSEGMKDAASFVEETGEFVCNFVTYALREKMNLTSAPLPRGENEMAFAGLKAAPSLLVKPPRVAEAPAALECKLLQIVRLNSIEGKPLNNHLVIGQVIGVHIDERFLKDGRFDTLAAKPIMRMGYHDYAVGTEGFTMVRPGG